MAKRKERILILLDTSVLVRAILNPSRKSASARVWQLWLQRRIQLAVTEQLTNEYLEVLVRLGIDTKRVQHFVERLRQRETVTWVNLGRHLTMGRDPNDEIILSSADVARVEYLVTLDKDLLELPWEDRRRLKFEILSPSDLLKRVE